MNWPEESPGKRDDASVDAASSGQRLPARSLFYDPAKSAETAGLFRDRAAASIGCQQQSPPPPPALRALNARFTTDCSTIDGQAFAARFVAVNNKVPSGVPLSSAEITDLSNAYCNAPATFRRQLDNIDFFFISADACNPAGNPAACSGITGDQVVEGSWGARLKGGYTQIGLPAGLWPMGQAAGQYTDYESDILASLVPWAAAGNRLRFSPPTSNPGNTNATWMTVLAALAHEAGHVRWWCVQGRARAMTSRG
jgi:hypothetical protein